MNPKRREVLIQCLALKMLTDFTLMYSSCIGVLLKRDGEVATKEASLKTPAKGTHVSGGLFKYVSILGRDLHICSTSATCLSAAVLCHAVCCILGTLSSSIAGPLMCVCLTLCSRGSLPVELQALTLPRDIIKLKLCCCGCRHVMHANLAHLSEPSSVLQGMTEQAAFFLLSSCIRSAEARRRIVHEIANTLNPSDKGQAATKPVRPPSSNPYRAQPGFAAPHKVICLALSLSRRDSCSC